MSHQKEDSHNGFIISVLTIVALNAGLIALGTVLPEIIINIMTGIIFIMLAGLFIYNIKDPLYHFCFSTIITTALASSLYNDYTISTFLAIVDCLLITIFCVLNIVIYLKYKHPNWTERYKR